MTFFSDLKQFVYDPPEFFDVLRTRNASSSWIPILLEVLASALLFIVYYRCVNLPWLHEQLLADVPLEHRVKAARFLTVNFLMVSAVVSVAVTVPLTTAILSTYFYVLGKVRNLPEKFGEWFLMVAWAGIVLVLTLPIGLVSVLSSDGGRIRPEEVNPLTLNQLVLHLDSSSRWHTLAESMNALLLIQIILLGIGYARWTKTSILSGQLVALVPFAAIYGTWAVVVSLLGSA